MNARTAIVGYVGIIVGIDAYRRLSFFLSTRRSCSRVPDSHKNLPPSQLRQDEEHQTLVWLRRPYHGGPLLTHGTTATRN